MRLAIDASRTTVPHITGTERYALEMIRTLIGINETLDAPHHITLYFRDQPAPDLFPTSQFVQQRVIPFSRLWTHIRFALALWQDRPDLTWVPAHTLPFIFPGKAAVTVHDLGYRVIPGAHKRGQWLALELYTRFSAWRANVVLADSDATRRDLKRFYRTKPDKVVVVYPGVNVPAVGDIPVVRAKYGIPERYWLYLGTLQPRKNIGRIVGAYHQWTFNNIEGEPAALVLAGGKGWKFEEHWVQGKGIILTGFVDEADKGALIAGAEALLFPSLYEGFGFPVVEAMGVGTPVICSDSSSLPELGGDAALYVKANNVIMLADRMAQLSTEPQLRAEMVRKGYEQAQKFTWEDAAWDALLTFEALVKS